MPQHAAPFSARARLISAIALILAMALAFAPAATAQDGPQGLDLDADDNIATAIDWSETGFPNGTDEVVLGRADLFADNLASGGLQGATAALENGRALLLTDSDSLRQDVIDELARLNPTTVHILGGPLAISEEVETQLTTLGYTTNRFQGTTRIETAIDVADTLDSDTVLVVRAFPSAGGDDTQAFADTIAAAAWAAENGWAVVFTQTEVLTESTAAHLDAAGYTDAFVIGGTSAINDDVFTAVDERVDTTTRVAGETRFETAIAIAEQRGITTHGDANLTVLVDGQGADAWADGFSAAALAGNGGYPVVLANSATTELPQETVDFLTDGPGLPDSPVFAAHLTPYSLICGTTTPDDQCEQAADIIDVQVVSEPTPGDTDNQGFTITPADFAELQNTDEDQATRQFTVEDAAADTTHTIATVPADNVNVDENGVVTFESTDGNVAAGLGETVATISQVNGSDQDAETRITTATPSPGLTYTITSAGFDEVVTVVFFDADEDGALDLNADGTPITDEIFGISGETRFLPAEGADGQTLQQDLTILHVDAEDNLIATADATYFFADEDTLRVSDGMDDAPVNGPSLSCQTAEDTPIADWFTLVTPGDQLDAALDYQSEDVSTACLEDITPVAPTLAVEETTSATVTLTVTGLADDATVTIYEADEPAEGEDPAVADDDQTVATVTEADDEDAATDGLQVTITELEASTDHFYYATQTLESQESDASAIVTATTNSEVDIATAEPVVEGGQAAQVTIQFTEAVNVVLDDMDMIPDGNIVITPPTGQPEVQATTLETPNGQIVITFNLDNPIPDAPQDITYTVTIAEDALTTVNGDNTNTELTATFEL